MLKKITFFSLSVILGYLTPAFSYCCNDPCNQFYIGIEGGVAGPLEKAHGNNTGGAGFFGVTDHLKRRSSGLIGARAGYFWNHRLRADISYSYLPSHPKWVTTFPPGVSVPTIFQSKLETHLVLVNLYGHLSQQQRCCLCGFDPYAGAGLGIAANKLRDISEGSSITGIFFANLESHMQKHFAARFQVGVMRKTFSCIVWDLAFSAIYLGRIATGDYRTLSNGISQPIGRYSFSKNWTGAVTLGMKVFFRSI